MAEAVEETHVSNLVNGEAAFTVLVGLEFSMMMSGDPSPLYHIMH